MEETRKFYPFNHSGVVAVDGDDVVVRVRQPGHLCGYSVFPTKDLPAEWRGNYDADALQYLNVHGGITYANVEGDWCVFGFDCAHADDEKHAELSDPSHVMALTKIMRAQIELFRSRLDEWKAADRNQRIKIIEEIRDTSQIKSELGFGALIGAMSGAKEFGEPK